MRASLYTVPAAAVLMLLAAPAGAHVAPAVDANNRYVKLTPMRDRVRLAYTVYIGEIPGAQVRRRMDQNNDGVVSEEESRGYAEELADGVVKQLDITWDGAPYALSWAEIQVGLGTPVTAAGSLSVDLIGWVCGQDRPAHTLILYDRYRVPRPGETELRLQQTPGIKVERSMLGRDGKHSQGEYKWQGNDGPLATLGYYLEFSVADDAMPPANVCDAGTAHQGDDSGAKRKATYAAVLLAALLFLGVLGVLVRRMRRASPTFANLGGARGRNCAIWAA